MSCARTRPQSRLVPDRAFPQSRLIKHWSDGGDTSLDNLVLLCRTHHRLVHEEGFTVSRQPHGAFLFRTPAGHRIENAPRAAVLAADPFLALVEANRPLFIGPRTCIPEWFGETADYNWITDSLWHRDHDPTANTLAPPQTSL